MAKSKTQRVIVGVAATVLVVVLLFPYTIMLLTSLKSRDQIYSIPPNLLPTDWVFSNYVDIWVDVPLAYFLINSLLVAAGATIIALACALPAAYALARMQFAGRRLYLYAIIMTQLFAPVVLIIGLFREMRWFGLIDSLWSLVLINGAFTQAFAVWLLSGYFSTIPYSLEEAAWVDGCTRWHALRKIVMPLALPGLVTTVIFVFIQSWNEFVIALALMSTPTKYPVTVGINSLFGKFDVQWEYVFTSALLATVPVMILFLAVERQLVSGLTAGGVKE